MTAALASSMLAACSLPKSSPAAAGPENSATFYVVSSEVSVTTQTLDPKISIPVSKTFSFKVCVRDNRLSQLIVNHKFMIETETTPITKMTDASGCLVWSEDIGYNHLAPAHFLELIRKIKAVGFQRGERALRFAINPWENQAESLLDKNREDLIPYKDYARTLMGESHNDGQELSRPVWVDDLRLTVYEKQISSKGEVLDFMIRASPSVVLITNTGARVLQPLTYGDFDTEVYLIHSVSENQKEIHRMLVPPVKVKGVMAEGYLSIEAPITLQNICTRGQIELGLKLTPKNAPKNLLPFEGVFVGSDCDQVKGTTFNRLTNVFQEGKGKMTIDQYLTDHSLPGTPLSSQDPQSMLDPNQPDYYQRGQVEIKKLIFSNVGFRDQRTIDREKLFNVTACMKVGLDQKGLRGQFFDVTKINGNKEHIKSNDDGCISWDDSYQFNFLDNESWKEASVHIKNNNLGLDQTLKIHLNPWGSNDTAFRDIRFVDSQGQRLYAAKGHTQIILNSYSYDKATYNYQMDSNLGLTMKKTVLFKLNPRIKRPSLTDPSGYSEEALPIGAYALRWAVVDMSVNDLSQARDKILQADEKLVYMNGNSTIAETLVLQTSDLKEIGSTNKIFVELYPLKENAEALLAQNPKLTLNDLSDTSLHLPHSIYWGALTLSNNNEGTTLVPYGETLISIFPALKNEFLYDQSLRLARAEKLGQKAKFAADNALAVVNLNDAKTTANLRANLTYAQYYDPNGARFVINKKVFPYSESKLHQWLNSGEMDQDLARKFCSLFSYEILRNPNRAKNVFTAEGAGSMNELCQMAVDQNVNSALNIQYRYFLKNPTMPVDPQTIEVRDAQVGASFAFDKSVSNSLSKSLSVSLSGNISAGASSGLEFISGSAGASYSVSKTHSENNGYGAQYSVSTGVSLVLEKVQATIQATGVEKCAVVKLGPVFFDSDQQEKASVMPKWIRSALGLNTTVRDFAAPTATNEDFASAMAKGVMVCDGASSKTPMTFEENYYVINQRLAYTTAVDPASDQSRPFFAVLRGDLDFNRFMTYIEASYTNPDTGTSQDVNKEMISENLRAMFNQAPTYPGQIVREH
jgi:hypothetical protein